MSEKCVCGKNSNHFGYFDCVLKEHWAQQEQAESPTFAYSLAVYLTRNNQRHHFDAVEMQVEIEQFMGDKSMSTGDAADVWTCDTCMTCNPKFCKCD